MALYLRESRVLLGNEWPSGKEHMGLAVPTALR